jgi:hypothetical protein
MKTLLLTFLLLFLSTLSIKAQMIEIPDSWNVYQGEYSGKPLLVRANIGLIDFSAKNKYPVRLGIAIPLNESDKDGLPTQKEQENLNTIEDSLFSSVEVENHTIVALIITTNGMREFVLYSESVDKAKKIASNLKSMVNTHEIQSYTEEDSSWSTYNQFAQ